MPLTGSHTYVGFGFGAIQAGLFLYEAYHSGNFARLVVAEVMPDLVDAIRQGDGYFTINIANKNRLVKERIGPIQIENPLQTADRQRLVNAIAEAQEIGTAVPDVSYYATSHASSLHRILAEGIHRKILDQGPRAVIYTAENHNEAADILRREVWQALPTDDHDTAGQRIRFLDTVIGKMSGVIVDPAVIDAQNLAPVTPGEPRAFLVESFNQILISQVAFDRTSEDPVFQRGISVFQEKPDLRLFEEAKLFGHNATHALAAYMGAHCGVAHIQDLQDVPGAMAFLRKAFIEESGAALIQKHGGADTLFTIEGYAAYADDLLERMINPYLHDTVARVGRNPKRKLGWNDRLVGLMRLALSHDIEPSRYAFGAAAAVALLEPTVLTNFHVARDMLTSLWSEDRPDPNEAAAVIKCIETGCKRLAEWRQTGFSDLMQISF